MSIERGKPDYVIVVGAGNAGLSAALSAREQGADVLILEKAPRELRGGNTRYVGGYRFTHKGNDEIFEFLPDLSDSERESIVVKPYSEDDYYADLMRVTQGLADPDLAEILVKESNPTIRWLDKLGVTWELWAEIGERQGNKIHFWNGLAIEPKGGGEGLVDILFEIAERMGVDIMYETKAFKLLTDDKSSVVGVRIQDKDQVIKDIYGKAVILACGGFEANPAMRTKYLGPGWDLVKVRGTRYNTGEGLQMALDIGAQPHGQWSGAHCSVIDANAPPFECGTKANRYAWLYGIMTNESGKRFLNEGEDHHLFTYAKFGRIILVQPSGIAYQIFDSKVQEQNLLHNSYVNQIPIIADSVEELASSLGIGSEALKETIDGYNRSINESVAFDQTCKDGRGTIGLEPPKSNWALSIDKPPYYAYPVVAGITFTFGGVRINKNAQVLDTEGRPIPHLYASGETTGGVFYYNYPGASGCMRGTVFGRIAGANAAKEKP